MPDSAVPPFPVPPAGLPPPSPDAAPPDLSRAAAARDAPDRSGHEHLLRELAEANAALHATRLTAAQRRIVDRQARALHDLQALIARDGGMQAHAGRDTATGPAADPGNGPGEHRAFDAGRIAHEIAERMRERADRRGLRLAVSVPEGGGPHGCGDPDAIRDVLHELLDNAIRHTVRGTVTLAVRDDGTAPRTIAFVVADTGVGLSSESRGRLFGPHPPAARDAPHGLAIAAARAARLGGELAVDAEVGQGSVFVFRIPAPSPARIGAGEPVPAPPDDGGASVDAVDRQVAEAIAAARDGDRALRVLVAEARGTRQAAALRLLTAAGHRVAVAVDGVDAIDAIATGDHDVVLMDLALPTLDGLEATRRIRAMRDPRAAVPIVGLVDEGQRDGLARCRLAGMDDAIARPLDGRVLLARLQAVVARAHRQHGHRRLCTGQEPGVDWQYLGDLRAALGAARFAATLAASAAGLRRALARLRVAADADLAPAARALRDVTGTLGLRDAFRLCGEVEAAAARGDAAAARARFTALNVEARQGAEAVRRHHDTPAGLAHPGSPAR